MHRVCPHMQGRVAGGGGAGGRKSQIYDADFCCCAGPCMWALVQGRMSHIRGNCHFSSPPSSWHAGGTGEQLEWQPEHLLGGPSFHAYQHTLLESVAHCGGLGQFFCYQDFPVTNFAPPPQICSVEHVLIHQTCGSWHCRGLWCHKLHVPGHLDLAIVQIGTHSVKRKGEADLLWAS